ncbi:transmembrane 6 superfamily member 1-like protein [Lates japonicus]|uniref:Transmembrane 6 superfamily member 1-like protein n=1 Tax=Lates japonicus TaxID=270547 RepID=A0AAD3QZW9_LATJO|nr:transmembrane 6 superfamily member 1-like protein [Lates japonicus]
MNTIPELQEPYVILGIGVAVLVIVFLFYFLITRGNPPKDALFFVFAEFSFTCVIDLTSALEYDGILSGFMEFYQKTGEPYLGTAYAIMMCYWDGIAHFIMYLVMISRITDRKAYRTLGLFWAGSLCANMSVFIAGIVAGKYGSEIRPAFWLNFLFLLVPVWGAVTLFTRPKDRPLIGGYNAQHAQSMKLIWRPLDLILVLFLLAAMAFTILRGLMDKMNHSSAEAEAETIEPLRYLSKGEAAAIETELLRDYRFGQQQLIEIWGQACALAITKPLLDSRLALHHQPQQHSLTRQTWPGRCGSLLPTAASSTLPRT